MTAPFPAGGGERWEAAELVAALDPGIATRMLAAHPAAGWCRACRTGAPCTARTLAEAAEAVSTRAARPASPG